MAQEFRPDGYEHTNEDEIERRIERAFDRLDARLMRGEIDQETYDDRARQIEAEAIRQYQTANQG